MATKRKMRRFDEGGVTDEDLSAANATEDPIATLNDRKKWTGSDEETPKQTFGQAFAAARKSGDKTFSWQGKSFTTDLASDKKASAPKVASKPAAAPAPAPAEKYETSFDRMNRKNREAGIDFDSLVSRGVNAVKERLSGNASGQRGQDRVVRDAAIRKSDQQFMGMKKGGSVKVSSASSRADGIAQRGKTRGTLAKHGK